MLRAVGNAGELAPFDGDAFGCRVLSLYAAYGSGCAFAQCWLGQGGGARYALARLDSTLTLAMPPHGSLPAAAVEELLDFLRVVGARTLVCPTACAQALRLPVQARELVMRLDARPALPVPAGLRYTDSRAQPQGLSLRQMHALLRECAGPDFAPPVFAPFYLDMSHRCRHGAALAAGFADAAGRLAACVAAALSPRAALLFAGAVRPGCRGQELLARLLSRVLPDCAGRAVYVFCGAHLRPYYERMGFVKVGEVAQCALKSGGR